MAERRVRFGIKVAQMTGTYEGIRDAWLEADRLGFDTAWAHDHLLNQNDLSAPEEEGWTILAALLALSSRIRGGLMVTANTFRHPGVLAKMVTTIDRISNGRVEVGLGAGWLVDEHEQYGIPLPPPGERLRMLDEACQVMLALWTQQRATFEGKHYRLREAYHEPKPIQQPHPPIWIGGSGPKRTLRITARYADVWNAAGGSPQEVAESSAILDRHCADVGRDPSQIRRSVQFRVGDQDLDQVRATAEGYLKVGVTDFLLIVHGPEPVAIAEQLAAQLPRLRDLG